MFISWLNTVAHLGLDEVQEGGDAALSRCLHLDGTAPNGPHSLTHEVNIDLRGVPARR